ncbi:BZ3500_MvSof-1268-A1-R1_Chr5-2g08051 [Microbotryum saponariae]|uniref:BZ3500_MvSof-1268-A1-R1_Chr5-2g08051 protein n=1 Tax=Microbotryum saponariae TaxID=289078 RepID=A0A2X0LKZ4_9BASI|nr:BZ3500_MvSof-1268-A1-R1_Chr5-2g08051 [Microbotryum saponariae]SDA05920.1 BZ3501_MvSof-1269-A2-R1_Chr5-2g07873 [Microbotryum saponariae]
MELVFDTNNKFLEYWADSPMITVTADVVDITQPMVIATVPIKWHVRSKPTFKWDHVHRVAQMTVVESGHLLNDKLERVDMTTAPAAGKYRFVTNEESPLPSPGVHRCMRRQQHRKQLREVFRNWPALLARDQRCLVTGLPVECTLACHFIPMNRQDVGRSFI